MPAPVRLSKTVSWGDCDPAGVVYTPRFADYAIEALHYFLAELLGRPLQERLRELGIGTPMKAMQFEFHRSLWPDQNFTMKIHTAGIRARSFDLAVIAEDATGALAFSARLSPVCTNPESRTAVAIPDLLRKQLDAHLIR